MEYAAKTQTVRTSSGTLGKKRDGSWKRLGADIRTNWLVYLIALPALAYFFIYCYMPMGGLVIAFKDYKISGSMWDAEWVGFQHFTDFFQSYYFGRLLKNTLLLSLETLVFGFPVPIIFALLLNECKHSCRMRNPEREVGKSCFFLQIASQSHFSGAFEAENNENGCISALGLK